jgi:DNA helicase-2/ATP-dependent DNA helicase PcrA
LRDQAVLMRASHHSDLLEVELTARSVPYVKYGGLKFLESAHVKDFVATARLVDNPTDEIAWFRLLKLHDGIGPARARALLADLNPGEPGVADRHADAVAAAPPGSRTALAVSLAAVQRVSAITGTSARAQAVLDVLRPLLVARYPDHGARLADLSRLVTAAAQAASLATFVADLTLDPPTSTSDLAGPPQLDEDYLVLSTVHSAKGLEWDSVHVIGAVDGQFPSDMALTSEQGLAEEQRLFYVATTRARDELAVYTPLRMPHHRRALDDRHSFAQQSRFLDDAAVAVMDVMEAERPGAAGGRPVAVARVAVPVLDDLWA